MPVAMGQHLMIGLCVNISAGAVLSRRYESHSHFEDDDSQGVHIDLQPENVSKLTYANAGHTFSRTFVTHLVGVFRVLARYATAL